MKSFKFSGLDMYCPLLLSSFDTDPAEVPGKIRVKAGTRPPEYRKRTGNDFSELVASGELRQKGTFSTGEVHLERGVGTSFCAGTDTFQASKQQSERGAPESRSTKPPG